MRGFLSRAARGALLLAFLVLCSFRARAVEPQGLFLGDSAELFVDKEQIAEMRNLTLQLQHPQPREVAIAYDRPWEGNVSCYTTILKDGGRYRMFFNGAHYQVPGILGNARKPHAEFTSCAESRDGLKWTRPVIGEVEFQGSKENAIVPVPPRWTHCFTPFLDTNPSCPPEERYKAVAFDHGTPGKLFGFLSPDGIHWTQLPEPILTGGAFDSQNLAFYDNVRGCYVAYVRKSPMPRIRGIATATSRDFRKWTELEMISCGGKEYYSNFYTNAIQRYPRSPRFLVGFPMLFNDNRLYPGNWGVGCGDGGFMASRDGMHFTVWDEAFLRPGPNRERWFNRCNYAAWGMAQTPGDAPGAPDELSLYYSEGYSEGREVRLRRCTLRLDGFVAVHAGARKGFLLTKPVRFPAMPEEAARPKPQEEFFRPVALESGSAARHFGRRFAHVTRPVALEIPESAHLGEEATFAIQTSHLSRGGERRFFSSFDKQPGGFRFCFHIYLAPRPDLYRYSLVRCDIPSAGRAEFGGEEFEKRIATSPHHHFAATYDRGQIRLYMDGELVAVNSRENPPPARLDFVLGNLRIWNDYPPNGLMNSAFAGYADDLLVLKRALSDAEVARLAREGAEATLDLRRERGMLYTFESEGEPWKDMLTADGAQDAHFPVLKPWGRTMLLLNLATGASRGGARVELRNPETGMAYPGFSLEECDLIFDDAIERIVSWRGKADLTALAGRPVQLFFELQDADLFSYRFGQPTAGK